MTESDRKYLTEVVLKKCWHPNRDDMMDLYEAVVRDEKWGKFLVYAWRIWELTAKDTELYHDFISWLYNHVADPAEWEKRCQMVADFYGWKEAGDEAV